MVLQGVEMDEQTRCLHYNSETDIIAIKFACCRIFFPCHSCHQELTDHSSKVWLKAAFDEPAIYCGACTTILTINQYLSAGFTCPECGSNFNPGCKSHYGLYFDISG